MERNQRFIIYSILALLYAAAIFILSSMPTIPLPSQYYELPSPDKLSHTALYFGLTILLCLSLSNAANPIISERTIILSFTIGTVYGILDEVHQAFVPGRTATLIDIAFDILGTLVAIAIFWYYERWQNKKVVEKIE
jgi:VanZ family protein